MGLQNFAAVGGRSVILKFSNFQKITKSATGPLVYYRKINGFEGNLTEILWQMYEFVLPCKIDRPLTAAKF